MSRKICPRTCWNRWAAGQRSEHGWHRTLSREGVLRKGIWLLLVDDFLISELRRLNQVSTQLSEASRTWFFPCFQNDGWEGRSRLRQMPGTVDAGICLSCCLPSSCYSLAGHRNLLALVENVCFTGMLRISALWGHRLHCINWVIA